MSEIQGKIQWLPKAPTEYPQGSGKYNIGLKIDGKFYNKHDEVPKLEEVLKALKVGFEVKLQVVENIIQELEVVSDKVEAQEKGNFSDDLISFETLLEEAHQKFKGNFTIKTEMISHDAVNKAAVFKATIKVYGKVSNRIKMGELETETPIDSICYEFQAHGDADQVNCQSAMIKPHYLRMAETRAIARALRWATNNAKTAEEETEQGQLTEAEMLESLEEEQTKP